MVYYISMDSNNTAATLELVKVIGDKALVRDNGNVKVGDWLGYGHKQVVEVVRRSHQAGMDLVTVRYETVESPVAVAERDRQAKERAYDRAHNEGGEGYNPHRGGARRTYRGGCW